MYIIDKEDIRGSSFIEYVVLILAVVLALIAMRGFIHAYIEGNWRSNIASVTGEAQYGK